MKLQLIVFEHLGHRSIICLRGIMRSFGIFILSKTCFKIFAYIATAVPFSST